MILYLNIKNMYIIFNKKFAHFLLHIFFTKSQKGNKLKNNGEHKEVKI